MNQRSKYFLFTGLMMVFLFVIGLVFWKKEVQYALPTPIPESYEQVTFGEQIHLSDKVKQENGNPLFLHFFNADCPCSKFNITEFKTLLDDYGNDIAFNVIIQSTDQQAVQKFNDKYGLEIPVILDLNGEISDSCGVYSTPQATIIKPNGKLYYRGNYNKARFCTQKDSRFADIALKSLLADKPLPAMSQLAKTSYGCELPKNNNESETGGLTQIFSFLIK